MFEYEVRNEGEAPVFDYGDKGLVSIRVNPGLSAYAEEPEMVEESLAKLVEFGKENVPKEYWSEKKIRLMATAGMRLLDLGVQEKILEVRRGVLRDSRFKFMDDWASVISVHTPNMCSTWCNEKGDITCEICHQRVALIKTATLGLHLCQSSRGIFWLQKFFSTLPRIGYANQVEKIPLDWALGAFILQSATELDKEHSGWFANMFRAEAIFLHLWIRRKDQSGSAASVQNLCTLCCLVPRANDATIRRGEINLMGQLK